RVPCGHQSPGGSAGEHQTFNLRVQGSSPCSGDELSVCYRPSAEATRDVALDIDPLNALGPEPTEMRWPEIETESAAWKTAMLTTIPPMQEVGNGFRGQKKNARSMQVTDRDKGTETIFVYARPGFGCRHGGRERRRCEMLNLNCGPLMLGSNPGSNPGHGIPFRAVVATALHRPMTPRTSRGAAQEPL
ncbi:hypothetical protein QQF64_023714, partial [Cirrhinus molitorella]